MDNVYEGYWARNGWTNVATEDTHSSIVIPGQAPVRDRFRNLELEKINIVPGQRVPVAGIAFAGDCGISKVEVSTDGGATWKSANIKDPLSKYTWVLWAADSPQLHLKAATELSLEQPTKQDKSRHRR